MKGQVVQLLESTFGERKLVVDREKCIVKGVKILGPKSRNQPPHNNEYPRTTRERAVQVLEGGRSFVNHDDAKSRATRRYQDSFGTHTNVREEGDGLYSDFHYNPKHPIAEQFLWDAENAPHNVGFSIATNGRKRVSGGVAVVEEILFDRNAHSIDLVCKGATTNSISEGQMTTPATDQPAKKIVKAVLQEVYKGDAAKLRIVEQDMPAAAMDASLPTPAVAVDSEDSADDQVTKAFQAMMYAQVDAFVDGEVDLTGLIAKIRDIAKAHDRLTGGAGTGSATLTDGTPVAAGQDMKLDPTTALREELAIRDQIEDAGLKFATPAARKVFVKSLVPLTEAERTALVEERKATAAPVAGGGDGKQPAKTRSAGTGAGSGNGSQPVSATGRIDESFKPAALTNVADKVAYLRNGRLPAPAAAK